MIMFVEITRDFYFQKRSDISRWGFTSIGVHPGEVATDLIENGPGKTLLSRLFVIPTLQTPSEGARASSPVLRFF